MTKSKTRSSRPIGIFCADNHLDLYAWSSRPELRGDSMWSFEYLVNFAIDNSLQFICLAGDNFEIRKPPSEVIQFFRAQCDRLAEASILLYFVQGQHCLADPPWPVSTHDWPIHAHEKLIDLPSGQLLYSLDWTPGDKLSTKLKAIPANTDIFMCHQVWLELMGALRPCEGSFTQIPYAPVVFTGDYHECKTLHLTGESGQALTVYSPGSTNMRKIDEPSQKFFFTLEDNNEWVRHTIPTRPVGVETITCEEELEQFCDLWTAGTQIAIPEVLPEHLRKPMLWFKFYDDIEGALRKAQAAVGEQAFLFPKLLTRESADEGISLSHKQRAEVIEAGLAGCLKLLVPEDDPNYHVLYRLLESKDPAVEIQALRSERFSSEVEEEVGELQHAAN